LWFIHREFSYESIGEIILKIGPHLPKLLSNIKEYTFFETQCTNSRCVNKKMISEK